MYKAALFLPAFRLGNKAMATLLPMLAIAATAGAATPPGSEPEVAVAGAAKSCAALAGSMVAAGAFALPTGGAALHEALLTTPAAGMPEYCRVRGAILAATAGDPPILFQVNLPSRWNLKTVQYGGGGYNGVLVEATGPFKGGALEAPALKRGYVTYGSDSGHQTPGASFYDNALATANYSHEAVKRTKDLVSSLMTTYYGQAARRNYHIGGSKGGQEGLQAAQNQSLRLGWNRLWHFAFSPPGGSLDTAGQQLLKSAVMAACDGLDGAVDGIVSNTTVCLRRFRVDDLRCPEPTNTGEACLTDRQILALKIAARPFDFAHPMPNGVSSVGPWPAFIGGDLQLWFGTGADGSQQGFYRATKVQPEALDSTTISTADWQANILLIPQVFDASNPNLDVFRAKGGKLILLQGSTDMLVPEAMTTQYFEALARRYGGALKAFARYYVVPGYGHGNGAFNMSWDSLAALDAWVEAGAAPRSPMAVDANPGSGGRQRPLCEYPTWPKYRGAGDPNRAENFECVAPQVTTTE